MGFGYFLFAAMKIVFFTEEILHNCDSPGVCEVAIVTCIAAME